MALLAINPALAELKVISDISLKYPVVGQVIIGALIVGAAAASGGAAGPAIAGMLVSGGSVALATVAGAVVGGLVAGSLNVITGNGSFASGFIMGAIAGGMAAYGAASSAGSAAARAQQAEDAGQDGMASSLSVQAGNKTAEGFTVVGNTANNDVWIGAQADSASAYTGANLQDAACMAADACYNGAAYFIPMAPEAIPEIIIGCGFSVALCDALAM